MTAAQHQVPRDPATRRKFGLQRVAAKRRGIDWAMSFDEWCSVWEQSGRWPQRGMGVGKYVMARNGDRGPYAPWNVRIILCEENAREARTNSPIPTLVNSLTRLGRGRGYTYAKGAYQVMVAHRYVGRFETPEKALAARALAVEEHRLRMCRINPLDSGKAAE